MGIKDILIAAGIIAAIVLLAPQFKGGGGHDTGANSVNAPRAPYPCESDRSAQCTWDQHRRIAEEDCAKYREQGAKCEIVTNGQPPRAIRIPSDGERADMRQKIEEGARRLCDSFAKAGYECNANSN